MVYMIYDILIHPGYIEDMISEMRQGPIETWRRLGVWVQTIEYDKIEKNRT